MAPKTPSRTNKTSDPDENRSPNGELVSPRRSRRSTNQSNGKQLTMTEMFGKKRPRESEESGDDMRAVKPKIQQEVQSEEVINKTTNGTDKPEPMDTKEENNHEVTEDVKVVQNGIANVSPIKTDEIKTESTDDNDNIKNEDSIPMVEVQRCKSCSQVLDDPDVKFYQGHPQNAVEEFIALTDEKLILTCGDDGDITERPVMNLTCFSVYDIDGHLCPMDGDLIENNVNLYASGYLKSICSDTADLDSDCVPVKDIGPINEWYIHGFDGGDQNCITLSTAYGEYNLKNPSEEYSHLMDNLYEKIGISKVTIEYLEEYHYLQPTYEDLLYIIKESPISTTDSRLMTEEMLHKHAKFICEQVVNLEVADDDDPPLVTMPCIRELIKLFGIKFGQSVSKPKIQYKKKTAAPAWTKATTTPLVRSTFEKFFSNQLDKQADKDLVIRRKRCGVCDACQLPDCGQCNACKAMSKYGGSGKTKKACIQRNCPNMAVEQAEESEPEDDDDTVETDKTDKAKDDIPVKFTGAGLKNICWIGEPVKTELNRTYYESVSIDNFVVKKGDFVMVETLSPNVPYLITKITCMWKESMNVRAGYFHAQTFTRARDTVLGEISDPREIFLSETCCNGAPLSSIIRVANVIKKEAASDWFELGDKDFKEDVDESDEKSFFYQKIYDKVTARFEDLPFDPPCKNEARIHRYCPSCVRKNNSHLFNNPTVVDKIVDSKLNIPNRQEWTAVSWREFNYKRGEAVFLMPETFRFKNYQSNCVDKKVKHEKVDESIYTEYYRKSDSSMRGSNTDTKEPFCVGYIDAVLAKEDGPLVIPQNIYLKLNVMYRSENTCKTDPHEDDLNLLYWSDRQLEVPFSKVLGPCALSYVDNLPTEITALEWSLQDFNRFYFKKAFNNQSETIIDVPEHAEGVGNPGNKKLKSKGKGKGKCSSAVPDTEEVKVRPLRALDVFAGCGGLSEGLHQAGIVTSRWAIEQMSNAARAYQLNNPKCTVYTEDCNALLKSAMEGGSHSAEGLPLPARGEVELLCGGPPCQGFSGMNRFNSREYSNFKNSLVATYLSYCDYYRPKYFILENVRNFAAFKKGMVLKMTLRCLLQIGYQCTFGVLQAGNYGVPQTRRRLIILAAAPGYKLPLFPEPTHVFSRRACNLSVVIDGKRYYSTCTWDLSAPRRTCTIRDAMSDLPIISNGAFKPEIDYGTTPQSHFQRIMRMKGDSTRLRDHICKNMAPLIQARICRIPTAHGSDWRDLPNIAVTLADGTRSKVLQYRHHDIKNGRGVNSALRGVCGCSSKRNCTPEDKQDNTLIPWCLPHTGNRHNHWAGLYGRVSWDGYFSTTVTDPEPMGKQGRILHPEQDRVVSVRECARSQGFPDSYIFAGSIQDKHRQIGNAVPPPLGAALGREIKIALMNKGKP